VHTPQHRPPAAAPDTHRRRALQRLAAAALAAPALLAQPARAQARSTGDVLVGRSTALTGGLAPFLAPIHQGQEAAIADCNAQGGIGGRKIRLITKDDGFDARRALDNARALVEGDGVTALFGQAGTSQVLALLPYLAQAKTPLIGVYTGSPSVRAQHSPWLFTTNASYADELVKIVRTLVTVQSQRIGVAYEDNDFGRLALPLVQQVMAAEGATLVGSHALASNGQDAQATAKALAAMQPQAVLMIAAGPPVVAYVRAHKAHMGVPIYTLSLGAGTQVIKALGPDAHGLAVARTTPPPHRATIAVTRQFQASMQRLSLEPDYDRFIGYLDARVLIEGLRAAAPGITGTSVASAMQAMDRLDLGGRVYQFSASNHNGSSYVDIAIVGPDGHYIR
jgi:ABC-type branched-subunit amino acid transport system substrate-binding protein